MSYIILCVCVYAYMCVCVCNVVIMKILEQKNIRQKNDEFLTHLNSTLFIKVS